MRGSKLPNPKYGTVAFDSGGELGRLYFSKAMNKRPEETENIRAMNDYPPATERLNMLIRRMKNLRSQGTEVVFNCHEDIQKVYARGGGMAKRGEQPSEPVAVTGQPDFPGNSCPNEMMRAADQVLRVRRVNGKPMLICRPEMLAAGTDYWVSKDRFDGTNINGGFLPFNYEEVKKLVIAKNLKLWNPAYTWIFFGQPGIGKTRCLLSFPKPLYIFDLDQGCKSIASEDLSQVTIDPYDVEDVREYDRFVANVAKLF